jgi:hypothetical protein
MSDDPIAALVDSTPFVDTHEHLLEESTRLDPPDRGRVFQTQTDFSVLFSHYADSDLTVAGMPPADLAELARRDVEPAAKWQLVEPYYQRAAQTGYLLNVRESVRALYGHDDLNADNVDDISAQIAAMIRPGFYQRILADVCNIEHCQVNSLETPLLMDTAYPALLCQDMSFVPLSTGLQIEEVAATAGISVSSLADWHSVVDWCFANIGPRAIALKNQSAYGRRLDYADVDAATAAPLFARFLGDTSTLTESERKAVEDHLFNYCLRRAAEHQLPVKLHTGYYAGHSYMPLHRLRHNAGDLCDLLHRHPDVSFVIMHITYPYQDEAIAIAKHYPNAWIDMCWAWIINPLACVRFVKEFLMAAPANKLFTFGGDYMNIEMVPGHARIARRGISQALRELVADGWVDDSAVPALVECLMRGNAHALFDYAGTLASWGTAGE